MSESKPVNPNPKVVIGKAGPVAGSLISILGNLFVLIGFVLPWVSCSGYRYSGLDIVTQGSSGNLGDTNGTLLGLIPFLAVGMIGIALLTIPASLWKKIPAFGKTIGTALIVLMTICACLPSCLFFTNIQSARNDPNSLGFGGLIHFEVGFWVTILGLFVSLLGGFLGIGTSIAGMIISRKPKEVSKAEQGSG